MSQETLAVLISSAVTITVGFITQLRTSSRLRGEFRSVLRNFPPHRHVNGKILYPIEYQPSEVEQPRG